MDEIVTVMSEDLHGGARFGVRDLSPGQRLALLVLLTAVCFAGGKIGLLVPLVQQRMTLLWPPTGIALAAVLLCGAWVWPAIALGSLLVSFSTGTPPVAATVIAVGNTLGALAGGWLLRRMGFSNRLERVRDVLSLLAFGVMVAPLVSAVVGVAALNLAWRVPSAHVLRSAFSWWLGDAMGVLLVAPALLTGLARPFRPARRERILEAATLGICLLAAGGLTLSSWSANPVLHPPLAFTLFPFLVWAALRLGPRGAAAATFLAVAVAFWATARGLAPFALGTVEERLMYLYSYTAVSVVTSMLLAAVFAERRRAEQGVRRSEASLRLALDAGRCGVWDWDLANQRLTWSEEVFAIHGIAPEDFTGRLEDFTAALHPEDAGRVGEAIRRALERREDYEIEFRIVRPDGEVRWINTNGRGFHDDSGVPVRMMGAMLDVTDRRHAEEERARILDRESEARAEAEAANEAKDHFLATLSHELRTPLTPVLLLASGLAEDENLPAGLRRPLDMIRRNVELEARLIDDLLDLTRITRGKLDLRLEVTDARKVVEHTIEICCEREATAGRLRVVAELAAEDHRLWADPSRLTQVLWNLLSNAVKFTSVGGTITVRSWFEPGCLLIQIADSGIGIDPVAMPHIFDAFEQGRTRSPRRTGGLGLGLAISKAIAEMHGGTLTAASAGQDQGAAFTLSLPCDLAVAELPDVDEPEIQKPKSEIQNLKILLVEDHADTAEAMADLLSLNGHQVSTAASVAEALALAADADGAYDFVISDLGLPDGSGLDLMRELSSRHGLRGIALSGYGMEEDVRQSLEAGFLKHLTKPVNLPVLQATLREVTRKG
jgi:PAS domain S-box-containing protein